MFPSARPGMDRAQLFDALSHLSPTDFERLLVAVGMPRMNRAGAAATVGAQVTALLEWAGSNLGPGLEAIARHLAELNQFEFDTYLESLVATYEKWWTHYTLTDATGKVELPQSEQPSVFDFGLMVQAVAKEKDSLSPEPRSEEREKTERLPVLEGIRKYADEHVLLVGRPGSGKSTALIRLLLEEANACLPTSGLLDTYHAISGEDACNEIPPAPLKKGGEAVKVPLFKGDLGGSSRVSQSVQSDVHQVKASGRGEAGQIPVLVELRYWQTSILERIRAFLYQHDPQLNLEDADLNALLRQGRFLLLIDGLNELPSDEARSQLASFRRDHPKVPMIFTTRDLGLGGDLGIEKKLEMQPLTEAQMKEFIRAYVPDQAEAMLRQLNNRLREFGQTPLLLWMLCEVFQQSPNRQMPNNLAEVFRAFTTMYEDSSVRKHEVALLKGDVRALSDRRLWKDALKALAALMMQGETPVDFRVAIHRTEAERELGKLFAKEKFPVRDIVDDLLKYHLLQNRTTDQLEFRHQLIQEYYAAEHLLDLLPELSDEQLKRDYLNLLKWTEAIAPMLALVSDEAQALRVVKLAMDDVDWMLGANLSRNLQPNSQKRIIEEITRISTASENLKVELLGLTRSNLAIPHLLPCLGNDDFDLQYTLNKALERISSGDLVTELTKLINDQNSTIRIASVSALEKIPTQKALQALRAALRHESPETRWSAAEALGRIGSLDVEEDLISLLSDPSPSVVRQAASALGKIGSTRSSHLILKKLQDSNSIDAIYFAHALAETGDKKAITSLIKLHLENDRMDFIISAIKHIEIPKEVVSIILEALGLEHEPAQLNAILAVGELNLKLATPYLIDLAQNEDHEIQGAAIEALGKLEAFEVKDLLIEKLESKSHQITSKAAIAVGRLNAKEAIPKLRALLHDKNHHVREETLYALSLMNHVEAWRGILDALENENINTRRIAVSTLKHSSLEEVCNDSKLLSILRSENSELAIADALEILGRSNFDFRFLILRKLLEHPNSIIRRGAIKGLRVSSEREAVNVLKEKIIYEITDNALSLDDDFAFSEAAYTIGEIGDSEDLPFLMQIFKETGKEYFLEAISSIQNRCSFYNYAIFHSLIPPGETISLYFSYALADAALQTQLNHHLTLLERQGVITSWSSHQILPGSDRTQTIHQQLNTADIILLLISPDAIADDTCYHLEIQRAIERHQSGEARVIPILLRPVDWQGAPFSQLDVLPKNHQPVTTWQNQDEAFREIAEGIRTVAMEMRREKDNSGKMDAP